MIACGKPGQALHRRKVWQRLAIDHRSRIQIYQGVGRRISCEFPNEIARLRQHRRPGVETVSVGGKNVDGIPFQ